MNGVFAPHRDGETAVFDMADYTIRGALLSNPAAGWRRRLSEYLGFVLAMALAAAVLVSVFGGLRPSSHRRTDSSANSVYVSDPAPR